MANSSVASEAHADRVEQGGPCGGDAASDDDSLHPDDRIQEVYDQDAELLRAMFVATFEAVKTTSPLRDRVRSQLDSGTTKVAAGLRKGIDDGTVSPGIDVAAAVNDITAAMFGIAFHWVVVPRAHDLEAEIAQTRSRIIRDYGG